MRQAPPILWQVFGGFRRYLLLCYQVAGATLGTLWLLTQIITSKTEITPAAAAFFSGIALIIVLVVLGALTVTIMIQATVLQCALEEQKALDELRLAIMHLLERLGEVPHDEGVPK